jgi:hypothetical protein
MGVTICMHMHKMQAQLMYLHIAFQATMMPS